MSGVQALVRLPMLQRTRDALAGLEHRRLRQRLPRQPAGRLRPGAVGRRRSTWRRRTSSSSPASTRNSPPPRCGARRARPLPAEPKKFDGVFGIWYGKGPGVDRCSDVFKHANMAGTSKHGGVIAIAGDDHVAKSSTAAHQSDHIFKACGLPVFFPSSVQDILDMGLHAFAMSRFAGVWSGMKTIQEVVESSSSVDRRPRPREDRAARGLRHAARRRAHPLARRRAGAGSAADGLQVVRRAGLRARQQAQPQRDRGPARPLRHHRQRQGLQRHAPGAGRPGPGRRHLPRDRHPAAQGQRGLAAGSHHHARLRAGPAGDPGRRGEAPGHRVPAQGRALQLAPRRAARTCWASSTRPRATPAAANGACPTRATTGCCAPRPT